MSLFGFNRGFEQALNRDIDNMGYQLMVMAKGCPYEAATLMLHSARWGTSPWSEISGGEMQRVAIARVLVNRPEILIADDPTGNLDSKRSAEIGEVLQALNGEGLTIVMVTHNAALARLGSRLVEMRDGRAVGDD